MDLIRCENSRWMPEQSVRDTFPPPRSGRNRARARQRLKPGQWRLTGAHESLVGQVDVRRRPGRAIRTPLVGGDLGELLHLLSEPFLLLLLHLERRKGRGLWRTTDWSDRARGRTRRSASSREEGGPGSSLALSFSLFVLTPNENGTPPRNEPSRAVNIRVRRNPTQSDLLFVGRRSRRSDDSVASVRAESSNSLYASWYFYVFHTPTRSLRCQTPSTQALGRGLHRWPLHP